MPKKKSVSAGMGIVGYKKVGIKEKPIFGERLHDGSLLLVSISPFKKMKYMGYSKREAIRKFKKVM